MAVEPIADNEPVRKFGQIIGFASRAIAPGDWVHEHNVTLHDFARDYRIAEDARNDEVLPPELRANFEGYVRPGGRTGTNAFCTVPSITASIARHAAPAPRMAASNEAPEIIVSASR